MRARHRRILLLPFLAALAAGCGADSGTPTGPEAGPSLAAGGRGISISPSTDPVSFGAVAVPAGPTNSTTQTFTVTNGGTRVTSALALAITGEGAAAYRIDPGDDRCSGRSLATSGKNKTCTFKVSFAPAAAGVFSATLSVTVAQPKTTVSVNFTGTGFTQPATIRIISQVVGMDAVTSYSISAVVAPGEPVSGRGFALLNGEEFAVTASVVPSLFTVSMSGSPAGYTLQGITCLEDGPAGYTNGATTVDLPLRTVNVNLQAGETVTCTFRTSQDG